MTRRHLLVVSVLVACDAAKPAPPAPAKDPWDTTSATPRAADPWNPAAVEPSPPSPPAPPAPSPPAPTAHPATGLPDGEWRCEFIGSSYMNGMRYTQPIAMSGFTLHDGAFTGRGGDGTIELDGGYALFHGGGFENWRGAVNAHTDGSIYLVFGGATHRDAEPGHGVHSGDVECMPAY